MNPITFPARPVNGGPLDKALPKSGEWLYEPKFNGWRVLVHVPTGTMFNRHGKPLSISSEFDGALSFLRDKLGELPRRTSDIWKVESHEIEWADCEGLERRHNIGRGVLVLLDLPVLGRRLRFIDRSYVVRIPFQPAVNHCIGTYAVYSAPLYDTNALSAWRHLQQANQELGCQFYEGLVAKREDSLYPVQLRSDSLEFPYWMKHRWAF